MDQIDKFSRHSPPPRVTRPNNSVP
jgi:hypothetical protein